MRTSLFLYAAVAAVVPTVLGAPVDNIGSLETRQCTGPNINTAAENLIKEFEGFVASPEPDPVGLPTVGYGHKCRQSGCSEVPYDFPLTQAEGVALLRSDLREFQQTITLATNSGVKLNANQYGALVSWAFNIGSSAARSSTLISRLNNGETPNTVAREELPRWNRAGGQVSNGLVRRRAAEVDLHVTSTSVGALPACG